MVKLDALKWEQAERPWFKIGEASQMQEYAIRAFAALYGYETLRGWWSHMQKEGWDYYDVIRMSYQ